MAGNIKGITIEIGGETTGLQKALKGVNSQSIEVQKELKQVDKLLKFDSSNVSLLGQKQQLLGDQVQNVTKKLKTLKEAQSQVEQQFSKGEIGADQFRAFQREIAKAESDLRTFKSQANSTKLKIEAQADTSGIDKMKSNLKELGSAAKTAGKEIASGLGKAGAAGAVATGGLVTGMQEYNRDLARLRTNAELAGNDLGLVEDAFKQVTAVTGETDSAVETVSNLLATGFKDNQLAGMIDQINGAAIKFSDTLKTEGIADGLQETFATGEAVGQFGELLERSGVDLKSFNGKLQEAQKAGKGTEFVMKTMADLGFGAVTEKYKEMNPEVQKNAEANANLQAALAELATALTPIVTAITELVTKLVEWASNNPTLATTLATISTIIGGLAGAFMVLSPVISALKLVWLALSAAFGMISAPIAIAIAAIAAIIAIGVLLYKNWDEISAAASTIWGSIKDFLVSCWEGIKTAAITIWDGLTSFFKTWGTTILAVITGPIGILVGLIVKNWDTIKSTTQTVWNGIKTFLSNLWNGIKSTASTVWNGIKTYFSTVLNAYKTSFTTIWNAIKTVVTNVWNGLKTTATTVWNAIKTYFTTVLNGYKTLFTTIWNAIKTVTTTVFNSVKSTISTIWNAIKSTTSSVLNGIKSVVSSIWNGIKSVISSVLNGIKSVVSSVWNGIKSTVSSVMSSIRSVINSGWNAAKSVVSSAVNGIKSVVSNIFNSLKSVVSSAMSGVKTAIQTGWNAAKSFLDGISLTSIGKNIVSGLVSGISSGFGAVKSKIKELASLVPDWAKETLGIHSPSRVMAAEVGKWIPEGIAVGIEKNLGTVKKASAKMASAVVPDFSSKIAITKSELAKLNKVISGVVSTHAKEINKIQKDADKQRETITSDANKKIIEIEQKAKESKKALTAAQERQIANIYEKAYKDRAKVTADEKKKISTLDKSLNADKLKALEEYVDKRKGLESMTTEQEVEFWKESVKKFKKGTEEKTQAQIKLNKAMDTLNKEQFDKEKDYIEDKKYYNKLSLSEELAAYQQYLKEHKKGSDERIYYEKEIYRVKQEIQKQIDKINVEYLSKVQALNQSLIDEENKLNEEYKKALDDRAKSLYSFAGIFDEIAAKDVSGETLLNNLQSQVTAFEDWQRNISELASKGINDGLLAELQEMGPKAGAEIAALNTLTDEQLQQYVSLWQEKNRLAKEQATKELEGMKIETGIKIEELKKDTATKLLGYQEEWRKAMVDAKLQVKNEAKEMPGIGTYAVSGLIDGMLEKKSALVSAAQELASIVKDTFQTALDIHSPSRVFKGFGVNINEGLIQGIQESSNQLQSAMNDVYGSMASSAGKILQTSGSTQRTNSYDHSKTMHNTFQINTVDSGDIVRKIERAQRRMAFEFGV